MATKTSRRALLKRSAAAAVAAALPGAGGAKTGKTPQRPPNIVIYHSDQFRWDFVGANCRNGSTRTPNIDAIAAKGKNFALTVTNQPVCAPSRSVLLTSRYATETGVWRNGLGLDATLPTLATELRKAGYTANYIGKWHLAPDEEGAGPVSPARRGGFSDLWEAANLLEIATHPYEGTIWDQDGHPIEFKNEYRVDFLTDRAERFLRQDHKDPFLLFISQLEPHQQNDMNNQPIAPTGTAKQFANAHIPEDLRAQPGNWQSVLPDYYGCIEAIDQSVGRIRRVLEERRLAENTIFVFLSDHGCHFHTRNEEYKRSTHNSSTRVPLLIEGPGFRGKQEIPELLGMIDIAPTLLEAAGAPIPAAWKGRSAFRLIDDPEARSHWQEEQLVQISESMTGRAIRTPAWTYCVADATGARKAAAETYTEYQMYDQQNDPHELVNLAGRQEFRHTAAELRERLKKLMTSAGEPEPKIVPAPLYP